MMNDKRSEFIKGENFAGLSKDFHFSLYASFPSQEQSLAVEFLDRADEYSKKSQMNNFSVQTRFKDEQDNPKKKWGKSWLREEIERQGPVSKIFICGNTQFGEKMERKLIKLMKDFDWMTETTVEVM